MKVINLKMFVGLSALGTAYAFDCENLDGQTAACDAAAACQCSMNGAYCDCNCFMPNQSDDDSCPFPPTETQQQEPPHGPGNDDPGHMCDPTECLDWTCLRWCSCYEKFPQKMELLDSWGEFEENGCGADSIPCNCGPWNSNEEVTIETMEVMNGTFINGMYIEPHTFRDELVGQLTFRDELAIKARERRLEKDRKLIEQGRKPYEVPDFRRNLINEWKEGKFDPLPKSTEKIPEFRENLKAEWAAGKFDPQIPEKLKLIFRDELKLEFLRLRQKKEDMRNSFNLPAFQRVMHTFRADLAEKWKHGDFDRMTHEEITHFFREKLEEQWKNGKFRLSSP